MSYVSTKEDLDDKLASLIKQADDVYQTAINAKNNVDFTKEEFINLGLCASEAMKISVLMTAFRKRICGDELLPGGGE